MTVPLDIPHLAFYYTIHSVSDRSIGSKYILYQSITKDYSGRGLSLVNDLIASPQLTHPLDLLRTQWLNVCPDLSPMANLSLRLTMCDVPRPIEFRLIQALCGYVAGVDYHKFIEKYEEYLESRAAHKVYGDIPCCFDAERCWSPSLTNRQITLLKATQLDTIRGYLTGKYQPEVAVFAK